MTDDKEPKQVKGEKQEKANFPHLEEALNSFCDGLNSLGLFCTEQAIPTAE